MLPECDPRSSPNPLRDFPKFETRPGKLACATTEPLARSQHSLSVSLVHQESRQLCREASAAMTSSCRLSKLQISILNDLPYTAPPRLALAPLHQHVLDAPGFAEGTGPIFSYEDTGTVLVYSRQAAAVIDALLSMQKAMSVTRLTRC